MVSDCKRPPDDSLEELDRYAVKIQTQQRKVLAQRQREKMGVVRGMIEESLSDRSAADVAKDVAAEYADAVAAGDPASIVSTLAHDTHIETYNGVQRGRPAVKQTLCLWVKTLGKFTHQTTTHNTDNDTVAVVFSADPPNGAKDVLIVDTLSFSETLQVAYIDRLVANEDDVLETSLHCTLSGLGKERDSRSYLARENCRRFFRSQVSRVQFQGLVQGIKGDVSSSVAKQREAELLGEVRVLRAQMVEAEHVTSEILRCKDAQLVMAHSREEYRVAYLSKRIEELLLTQDDLRAQLTCTGALPGDIQIERMDTVYTRSAHEAPLESIKEVSSERLCRAKVEQQRADIREARMAARSKTRAAILEREEAEALAAHEEEALENEEQNRLFDNSINPSESMLMAATLPTEGKRGKKRKSHQTEGVSIGVQTLTMRKRYDEQTQTTTRKEDAWQDVYDMISQGRLADTTEKVKEKNSRKKTPQSRSTSPIHSNHTSRTATPALSMPALSAPPPKPSAEVAIQTEPEKPPPTQPAERKTTPPPPPLPPPPPPAVPTPSEPPPPPLPPPSVAPIQTEKEKPGTAPEVVCTRKHPNVVQLLPEGRRKAGTAKVVSGRKVVGRGVLRGKVAGMGTQPRKKVVPPPGAVCASKGGGRLPPLPAQARAERDYWEIFRCWKRIDPTDTGTVPLSVLQRYWQQIFHGRTQGRLLEAASIAAELRAYEDAGCVSFPQFTSLYLNVVAPTSTG